MQVVGGYFWCSPCSYKCNTTKISQTAHLVPSHVTRRYPKSSRYSTSAFSS